MSADPNEQELRAVIYLRTTSEIKNEALKYAENEGTSLNQFVEDALVSWINASKEMAE